MGSGKVLKRAIEKYGVENFKKEILFLLDSEEEMNLKEKELVTEEFCLSDNNYNLCVGGQGGFSYINRLGLNSKGDSRYVTQSKNKKGGKRSKEFSNKLKTQHAAGIRSRTYWGSNGKIFEAHTGNTKEKMRRSNRNSQRIKNIEGKVFYSLTEASKFYKVSVFTIKKWILTEKMFKI